MVGLVEELQRDALDTNVRVDQLLRKVKLAAVKLGLSDALLWVDEELNGYQDREELPDYRKTRGQTIA
ncbi:MAG: hypothetical protein C0471_04105 [Erythrobacter sp.]|nr:hypothetical protein [Erythrobacter sp.]